MIEHLDLKSEVLPLLCETLRVLVPGGELWLSTPDIEKVCRSYLDHRMQDMVEDRKPRWRGYSLGEYPSSQMINDLFHQGGSHLNLFDFTLMDWALSKCGFVRIQRTLEADLLERFPGFPVRNDDLQTLYVRAWKPQEGNQR
jgi:predicted SAM-dependent methyltransferase